MDADALLADLTNQEAYRALVYDDRTGKPLAPGVMLMGNPTVGIGWNVAGRPCSRELANIICRYQINEVWGELVKAMPWVAALPEPQQRAMTNLSFNMGLRTLSTFTGFLSLMQTGHYAAAANDLGTTLWFKRVGTRGPKIQALITEGAQA